MTELEKTTSEGESIPENILTNEENLGLILWQLETLENFYPMYKNLIGKENKKSTTMKQ
jgi:hypothetical protein